MSLWGKSLLHPVLKGLTVPINHSEHSVWISCPSEEEKQKNPPLEPQRCHSSNSCQRLVTAGWMESMKNSFPGEEEKSGTLLPCVCEPWCTLACCILPCQSIQLQVSSTPQTLLRQGWRLHYSAWQAALRADRNLCLIEFWQFSFTLALTVYLTGLKHDRKKIQKKTLVDSVPPPSDETAQEMVGGGDDIWNFWSKIKFTFLSPNCHEQILICFLIPEWVNEVHFLWILNTIWCIHKTDVIQPGCLLINSENNNWRLRLF